jgi:OAA-family lectin sugar binding domain
VATYETEIHTGGGGWQPDEPLSLSLANRSDVVPENGAPATGTTVTWSSDAGNGSVTFFDNGNNFQGTAQFPGEGPVGYRGKRSD